MRRLASMTAIALFCAPSAWADNGRLDWPPRPRPAMIRVFDALSPHEGCAATACLHWGATWGAASRADYVDPPALLASTRLKPLGG